MACIAQKAAVAWDVTRSFGDAWWCIRNQVLVVVFKWLVDSFTGTSDVTLSSVRKEIVNTDH